MLGTMEVEVRDPSSLARAEPGGFSFCKNLGEQGKSEVRRSLASVVVVPMEADVSWARDNQTLIRTPTPRRTFVEALQHLVPRTVASGVHPTALVDPTASIDPTASVGAQCCIGPDCWIGAGTVIQPHVIVGSGTRIGCDSTIFSGSVIGSDGFGYERDLDGSVLKFPHLGTVRIGDRVEIGSNVCIDRGTLDETVIENDAKIDNLVHIAHNVRVGEGAFVIALSMIGGSVDIGPRAWVAPGSCVMNGAAIGQDATVGLGAVVIRPVEPNETVVGNPARPLDNR